MRLSSFPPPSVVITLFLSGFSTFLVYQGQYEAAMAGAGVAVAISTSRTGNKEESELDYWKERALLQDKEHEIKLQRQYFEQQLEIKELKHQIALLSQNFEQQVRIKELELKLREQEQLVIFNQSEAPLLPQFEPVSFSSSLSESKSMENPENREENQNE